MATITEDYVSFKIAKLLKDKGFNEECFALYNPDSILIQSGIRLNNIQVGRVKGSYSAPTIQMAMKWLREVYKISIEVFYFTSNSDSRVWAFEIIKLPSGATVYGEYDKKNYEEACEEAIKYCLENLI